MNMSTLRVIDLNQQLAGSLDRVPIQGVRVDPDEPCVRLDVRPIDASRGLPPSAPTILQCKADQVVVVAGARSHAATEV